jgi:hypothetical protein
MVVGKANRAIGVDRGFGACQCRGLGGREVRGRVAV